ncbi:MAG: polysaccharide biosynthesis/export family protein [Flavobacteriia bacterium]|nr:polysaccharide biosynthesis/export family protein [Flavobacteriia bacterium]
MQTEPSNETVNNSYSPTIKVDDLLSINVTAINKQAVEPFNLPISTQNSNTGYTLGAIPPPGFLVDQDGYLNFPILGKIQVKDKTRSEVTELLQTKLKEYVENPVVSIRILNYKVTVLGEVERPGTYTIPNERITILEAIGLAGDLKITGLRKNILVVREVNGVKKQYRIDITKSDFLSSPVYFLCQNDVVYVEPNRIKINSAAINTSNAGIIISAVSLMITTLVLITK